MLGIYGMGNIGSAIAAYAAPAIAAFYGWQWAFWVFILPLVAMAAVFWILGRDAPSTGPRPSVTAGISLFRREVMPWVLSLFYFLTFGGFDQSSRGSRRGEGWVTGKVLPILLHAHP